MSDNKSPAAELSVLLLTGAEPVSPGLARNLWIISFTATLFNSLCVEGAWVHGVWRVCESIKCAQREVIGRGWMFDINTEDDMGPSTPRTWLANCRSNVLCTATLALDVGREGRWWGGQSAQLVWAIPQTSAGRSPSHTLVQDWRRQWSRTPSTVDGGILCQAWFSEWVDAVSFPATLPHLSLLPSTLTILDQGTSAFPCHWRKLP